MLTALFQLNSQETDLYFNSHYSWIRFLGASFQDYSFPGAVREEQLTASQAHFCGCCEATLHSCSVPYTTKYFFSEMWQILPLPGVFPSALKHVKCLSWTSLLPSIIVFYTKMFEKIVKYVRDFQYIFYYIVYVHSLTMFHGHIHHFSKIKGF